MASWPSGLPSPYAAAEPTYTPYDNVIRSPMDTGPGKVRRRFTGKNEKLTFDLVLTYPQRTTFWAFYDTTISEVLPFDWVDLRTGSAARYRFAKRPAEKWVGGDTGAGWWAMSIELDMI